MTVATRNFSPKADPTTIYEITGPSCMGWRLRQLAKGRVVRCVRVDTEKHALKLRREWAQEARKAASTRRAKTK